MWTMVVMKVIGSHNIFFKLIIETYIFSYNLVCMWTILLMLVKVKAICFFDIAVQNSLLLSFYQVCMWTVIVTLVTAKSQWIVKIAVQKSRETNSTKYIPENLRFNFIFSELLSGEYVNGDCGNGLDEGTVHYSNCCAEVIFTELLLGVYVNYDCEMIKVKARCIVKITIQKW